MTASSWRCVFWFCIGLTIGLTVSNVCHADIIVFQPWPGVSSGPQPVAWYKCEETSGTNIVDAMGSWDGTAGSAVGGSYITSISGKIGNALDLAGNAAGYWESSTSFWSTWPDSYTVCMWFRVDGGTTTALWSKCSNTVGATYDDYFALLVNSGYAGIYGRSANSIITTLAGSTTNLTAGVWRHAALVITPDSRTIYINGDVEASDSVTTRPRDDQGGYSHRGNTFGALHGPSVVYAYNGPLDDCRIYEEALTEAQIEAIIAEAP